jgi:hypothetical protein
MNQEEVGGSKEGEEQPEKNKKPRSTFVITRKYAS